MKRKRGIRSYFVGVLKNIDIISKSDFYEDKQELLEIRNSIEEWYCDYKKNKSLKSINSQVLKDIDQTITDYFAVYVTKESADENYVERLLFDFSQLEHYWKSEIKR